MATRVNYDDNLFFVMTLTRALRSGLQLDIDPDYFRDKVVEDVFFIDRTLEQIYEALRTNSFLINRRDHLRELMRAKRNFADTLDEVLEARAAFSEHLEPFRAKLAAAREQHVRDISDIQRMMESGAPEADQETIVSQDEYRFLFQSDEDSEG
ncbi:MAG: hypothetical protein ACOCZB_08380 [Spirochaetota bacterium]